MLPHRVLASLAYPAQAAPGPLFGIDEPVAGARALVIGHGALEAMCGLIRRGCTAAAEWPLHDRRAPEPDSADIVIVPEVGSFDEAREAIAVGGRALAMGGQIAVGDATGALAPRIVALLRAQGFCSVRTRAAAHGTVVTAERPIFGPLHGG